MMVHKHNRQLRIVAERKHRKRVLKGGTIMDPGSELTLPCIVRNMTDGGARIQLKNGDSAPNAFDLYIEKDGVNVPCEVAWRQIDSIGVRFSGVPTCLAGREVPLLIVEDDLDDRDFITDALRECEFEHPIKFVQNGEEALKYLRGQGPFEGRSRPGLVLLDLNMPRMDGRTALMHIKTDPSLKEIPVIVLSTSIADEDIQCSYQNGANAFLSKPNSQDDMISLVKSLNEHWMRFVALPTTDVAGVKVGRPLGPANIVARLRGLDAEIEKALHLDLRGAGKLADAKPTRGVIISREAVMPTWIGPAQKADFSPEFMCGATIGSSIPMRLRAQKNTPHLTICVGHIPDVARRVAAMLQRNGSVSQLRTNSAPD